MNVFLNIELLPCSNVERYREAFSDPCQPQTILSDTNPNGI
jgi:hypothetical protein